MGWLLGGRDNDPMVRASGLLHAHEQYPVLFYLESGDITKFGLPIVGGSVWLRYDHVEHAFLHALTSCGSSPISSQLYTLFIIANGASTNWHRRRSTREGGREGRNICRSTTSYSIISAAVVVNEAHNL